MTIYPDQQHHRELLEKASEHRKVKPKKGMTPGQRVMNVLKYLAQRSDRGKKEQPAQEWHKKFYGEE